jgi:hypothetical protein
MKKQSTKKIPQKRYFPGLLLGQELKMEGYRILPFRMSEIK